MNNELVSVLKNNGVAVIATDTLYGVVGSALSPEVVERIYEVKGRTETKPVIVLVASVETLADFGVALTENDIKKLNEIWPNAVTILFKVSSAFSYIHRGTGEIAFRFPKKDSLRKLLEDVGPLVAPSANPEGETPAHTIEEAKKYFADKIDWYEDEGYIEGLASTIIRLRDGQVTDIIRQGAVEIEK
jgi:L-threonylcarbamoyladenylate synthase